MTPIIQDERKDHSGHGNTKEALENDWEQTKNDIPGLKGADIDQDVDDTAKQAAGKDNPRTPNNWFDRESLCLHHNTTHIPHSKKDSSRGPFYCLEGVFKYMLFSYISP